jgi:hypothetical protein
MMAHPSCHDEVMMEGEGRRKAHENIIRPKAGINSVVAFKRYVGLTLDDGSTMKVKIAEGSTAESGDWSNDCVRPGGSVIFNFISRVGHWA